MKLVGIDIMVGLTCSICFPLDVMLVSPIAIAMYHQLQLPCISRGDIADISNKLDVNDGTPNQLTV